MGKAAGVNTASLGGYLHSSKTRARWAVEFHDELLNGHMFNLERGMGSVRLYLARDLPYDEEIGCKIISGPPTTLAVEG